MNKSLLILLLFTFGLSQDYSLSFEEEDLIIYDTNGSFITNPTDSTCFPKKLDDLAMPKWESLPFEKYEKISLAIKDATSEPLPPY